MDLEFVLSTVQTGSIEERLQLMEAIKNRLLETSDEPELTEGVKAELDSWLMTRAANLETPSIREAIERHLGHEL